MPKRFYVYFLFLTLFVVGITGISSRLAVLQAREYNAVFKSQEHTMIVQKEIAIAQDYANNLARVLDLEAQRAHELGEKLIEARQAFMNLLREVQRRDATTQLQLDMLNGYIGQLIEYMEDNKLPVPAPDPNVFVEPSFEIEVTMPPPPPAPLPPFGEESSIFEVPSLDVQGPE